MPVIDRKFSPETLRNIQGSQATFYSLLSKLPWFEFPFQKNLTLETLPLVNTWGVLLANISIFHPVDEQWKRNYLLKLYQTSWHNVLMDKLFNPSQVSNKILCLNGHARLSEFHDCSSSAWTCHLQVIIHLKFLRSFLLINLCCQTGVCKFEEISTLLFNHRQ